MITRIKRRTQHEAAESRSLAGSSVSNPASHSTAWLPKWTAFGNPMEQQEGDSTWDHARRRPSLPMSSTVKPPYFEQPTELDPQLVATLSRMIDLSQPFAEQRAALRPRTQSVATQPPKRVAEAPARPTIEIPRRKVSPGASPGAHKLSSDDVSFSMVTPSLSYSQSQDPTVETTVERSAARSPLETDFNLDKLLTPTDDTLIDSGIYDKSYALLEGVGASPFMAAFVSHLQEHQGPSTKSNKSTPSPSKRPLQELQPEQAQDHNGALTADSATVSVDARTSRRPSDCISIVVSSSDVTPQSPNSPGGPTFPRPIRPTSKSLRRPRAAPTPVMPSRLLSSSRYTASMPDIAHAAASERSAVSSAGDAGGPPKTIRHTRAHSGTNSDPIGHVVKPTHRRTANSSVSRIVASSKTHTVQSTAPRLLPLRLSPSSSIIGHGDGKTLSPNTSVNGHSDGRTLSPRTSVNGHSSESKALVGSKPLQAVSERSSPVTSPRGLGITTNTQDETQTSNRDSSRSLLAQECELRRLLHEYNDHVNEGCHIIFEEASSGSGDGVSVGSHGETRIEMPAALQDLDLGFDPLSDEQDPNDSSMPSLPGVSGKDLLVHLVHHTFHQEIVDIFCFGARARVNKAMEELLISLSESMTTGDVAGMQRHVYTLLNRSQPDMRGESHSSITLSQVRGQLAQLILWSRQCPRPVEADLAVCQGIRELKLALKTLVQIMKLVRTGGDPENIRDSLIDPFISVGHAGFSVVARRRESPEILASSADGQKKSSKPKETGLILSLELSDRQST